MTVVEKSHISENYYITLEIATRWDKSYYLVQASPRFDNSMCGYPVREMTYPISDKKNAYATFNRYKRKYI